MRYKLGSMACPVTKQALYISVPTAASGRSACFSEGWNVVNWKEVEKTYKFCGFLQKFYTILK